MAKIFIKTFGCSANYNNSEIMAGLLIEAGYSITKKAEKKDLIREIAPKASLVGIHHVKNIAEVVEKIIANKTVEKIGKRNEIKLNCPELRKNPIIQIVQISEGCNGICSYCIVKLAKGKLFSYPEKEIVKQIELGIKHGCKEIWLTSQDTAAYGQDIKADLVSLLRKIVLIKGDFKVRVGMMDPNNLVLILGDLIKVMKSDKIFKFLHIPVQSGNDEILKKMKRPYTINDLKKIIKKLRKEIPEITISTDIICGFPSETEEEQKLL